MRVIGVGSDLRGDDGAGLAVARRLASAAPHAVEVLTCVGGVAELLDAWEGAEEVVVVDAMRSGRRPGAVVDLTGGDAAGARRGGSTHDAGVADALALGAALGRLPASIRVVGIEAGSTQAGLEALSAPVERAVAAVVASLISRTAQQERTAGSVAAP